MSRKRSRARRRRAVADGSALPEAGATQLPLHLSPAGGPLNLIYVCTPLPRTVRGYTLQDSEGRELICYFKTTRGMPVATGPQVQIVSASPCCNHNYVTEVAANKPARYACRKCSNYSPLPNPKATGPLSSLATGDFSGWFASVAEFHGLSTLAAHLWALAMGEMMDELLTSVEHRVWCPDPFLVKL